jgi:hypothetical protein
LKLKLAEGKARYSVPGFCISNQTFYTATYLLLDISVFKS